LLVGIILGQFFLVVSDSGLDVNSVSASDDVIYIDGSLSTNCVNNYSVANRRCTGSNGNAYNTLEAGLAAASAGDTINIRAGTYTISDTIDVNFNSDSLTTTIQAYNSESVTIDNTVVDRTTLNISTGKNILFKDLHFTGVPYYVPDGWTNYSGNIWSTTIPYTTSQFRFNSTNGSYAYTILDVNTPNEYHIAGTTLYVYSVGDPAVTYTNPGVNFASNTTGFALGDVDGIPGNLISIDNCVFEDFGHAAIKGDFKWHVFDSRFYNNGTDTSDHHIFASGIQTSGNEMIFENNYFGFSPGSGVLLYDQPEYAIVRNNIFNMESGSSNSEYGVLLSGSNLKVFNNTIYGAGRGIAIDDTTSQNNEIKNNIIKDSTVADLKLTSASGNDFSNNYLGSEVKCTGCSDYTGTGGPNYTLVDDEPQNILSSSPWTHFTYNFNALSGAHFRFFSFCSAGDTPTFGTWYLDDLSITPLGGGAELVTNGGMESFSGNTPVGWAYGGALTGQQETEIVHSGNSSLKLNLGTGCGGRLEQYIDSFSGDYVISGWAKRETGTGVLPYYIGASIYTSDIIGDTGPDFEGTEPYSEPEDFKIDLNGADVTLLVNNGENLGANNSNAFDLSSTGWPLNKISQSNFGEEWDLGPFIYSNAPSTSDNVDADFHYEDVTVNLTCTPSGVAQCANTYYTTDGSTPTLSSSQGTSFTLTYDGFYTIKYFSVDEFGNQESVKTAVNQVKISKPVFGSDILTEEEKANQIACGRLDVGGKSNFVDDVDYKNLIGKYGKSCSDISATFDGCGRLDHDENLKIDVLDFVNLSLLYGQECK
ncbi:chitobiase/beta-hexosaminidase C-terminal domain-containing protein, partial [Candidatus Dojkabacteria bacterium]|nr:chitobiase/beta-hexosaminidase C-terminal domain-containing protein [Candidatus Dojkabacteria bacterium]